MVRFQCYLAADGADVVRAWYVRQRPAVQAAMVAVLASLERMPKHWWRRKPYAALGGKRQSACRGLGEIRFNVDGVEYRLFGFFTDEDRVFVILFPFDKPSDPSYSVACPEAQARKMEVTNDAGRRHRCSFP